MNGAHDLGGMHGLGPINPEPEKQEPVFHAEWERRVFGLTMAAGWLGLWNLEMVRFARERQHPAAYLRQSYYENWLVGLETLLIESGVLTESEMATATSAGRADERIRQRVLRAENVQAELTRGSPATMPLEIAPRFKGGDAVRAVNRHPLGHTREPRYVRGHVGVIYEYLGAHIFPDRNAIGIKEGQPLYNVRFDACELWGEGADQAHKVYVALWESYLEPAEGGITL